MENCLCKILADFKVISYKIHVLHTSMQGELFISYHAFLGELYSFFEDNIDDIMEDMEQLHMNVPTSIDDLLDESDIVELKAQITDPKEQMVIIESDLKYIIENLQKGIILCGEKNDLVIQNNLIDYQKEIRKFERKNRRMMGEK